MSFAEISQLKAKINDIEQDLGDFSQEIFKIYTKKSPLIEAWALTLEKLHELGEFKDPIDTICWHIGKRLKELGFSDNADSWVRRTLTNYPRFKDQSKVAGANAANAARDSAGLIPQEEPSKPIAIMTRDELREHTEKKVGLARELKRRAHDEAKDADALVQICEDKGIALQIHKKKEPISTQKDPQESAAHIAMGELIEVLESLSKKIYEMPPRTPEDDALISQTIQDLITYLKPLQDEKWSKSFLAWLRIQLENIAYGKHAAGSRAATSVLIIEEETQPDGTVLKKERIEQRKLTKEQVGDRLGEILEISSQLTGLPIPKRVDFPDTGEGDEEFIKAQENLLQQALDKGEQSFFVKVLSYSWHGNSAEPRIARRKIDLNPTLSENAFGNSSGLE